MSRKEAMEKAIEAAIEVLGDEIQDGDEECFTILISGEESGSEVGYVMTGDR